MRHQQQFVLLACIFLCGIVVCTHAWAAVGRFDNDKTKETKTNVARDTKIQNFGDALIENVKIYNLFWNDQVPYQATLDYFTSSIVQSSYIDWASEYSTAAKTIGRGTWIGSQNLGASSTTVTEDDLAAKLTELIEASLIPAPDANTLYLFYFDQLTSITTSRGYVSCATGSFCGFHTIFNYNKGVYPFAVIADCPVGCGPSRLDSLTVTVSHEIIESVTDTIPQQGWYDPTTSLEICDVCETAEPYSNPADGRTWYVNPGWSNSVGGCVVVRNGYKATDNTTSSASRSASSFITTLIGNDIE